jgi:hypothetical protein
MTSTFLIDGVGMLPKGEPRQVVAPRQETTTGAARASEPLCIAQGAVANVPKFPRPPAPSQTRQLITSAASPTGIFVHHSVPRSTFELQDVFCTTFPENTYPLRHTRPLPCLPRLHQAIDTLLTPLQTLKTRRKKNVKKGIQFCLMVCGASGTGRTTFVNTLCGKKVLEHKESDDPTVAHVEEGVKIQPITVGMSPQWIVMAGNVG